MKLTEAEWRLRDEFHKDWHSFCDADPVAPDFPERMEAAGFIKLVPVTREALEESFAAERGIEPGGMMWQITDAGRTALAGSKEGDRDE